MEAITIRQSLDIIAQKSYVAIEMIQINTKEMSHKMSHDPKDTLPDENDAAPENEAQEVRQDNAPPENEAQGVKDTVAEILADVTPPEAAFEPVPQAQSLDDLSPEEQVNVLQEMIAKLNDATASKDDEILRYAAELQNTRRRAEKDRADALKYGVTGFARDMVAVGDNLLRALNALEESDREGLPDNVTNLLAGVAATERDLMATLQRNGVKPLNPLGEKFDAHFHEALFEAPDTGKEAGTIIQVMENGFMIGERLLRAAKVGVAKD